jgi:hypothetical protein
MVRPLTAPPISTTTSSSALNTAEQHQSQQQSQPQKSHPQHPHPHPRNPRAAHQLPLHNGFAFQQLWLAQSQLKATLLELENFYYRSMWPCIAMKVPKFTIRAENQQSKSQMAGNSVYVLPNNNNSTSHQSATTSTTTSTSTSTSHPVFAQIKAVSGSIMTAYDCNNADNIHSLDFSQGFTTGASGIVDQNQSHHASEPRMQYFDDDSCIQVIDHGVGRVLPFPFIIDGFDFSFLVPGCISKPSKRKQTPSTISTTTSYPTVSAADGVVTDVNALISTHEMEKDYILKQAKEAIEQANSSSDDIVKSDQAPTVSLDGGDVSRDGLNGSESSITDTSTVHTTSTPTDVPSNDNLDVNLNTSVSSASPATDALTAVDSTSTTTIKPLMDDTTVAPGPSDDSDNVTTSSSSSTTSSSPFLSSRGGSWQSSSQSTTIRECRAFLQFLLNSLAFIHSQRRGMVAAEVAYRAAADEELRRARRRLVKLAHSCRVGAAKVKKAEEDEIERKRVLEEAAAAAMMRGETEVVCEAGAVAISLGGAELPVRSGAGVTEAEAAFLRGDVEATALWTEVKGLQEQRRQRHRQHEHWCKEQREKHRLNLQELQNEHNRILDEAKQAFERECASMRGNVDAEVKDMCSGADRRADEMMRSLEARDARLVDRLGAEAEARRREAEATVRMLYAQERELIQTNYEIDKEIVSRENEVRRAHKEARDLQLQAGATAEDVLRRWPALEAEVHEVLRLWNNKAREARELLWDEVLMEREIAGDRAAVREMEVALGSVLEAVEEEQRRVGEVVEGLVGAVKEG